MKRVHITLQGKGGVGKSLAASLIAQYYENIQQPVICIDTDPVNATLSGYQKLYAQHIQLMDGSRLDERKFDDMVETILENDSHYVVDNGAASFIPLSNYLIENDVIDLINQKGKNVIIHTVITGGQALLDTLNGFAKLAEHLPAETPIMIWLNEYFGPIVSDGKNFEEMKVYAKYKDKIKSLIKIQKRSPDTFGKDFSAMLDSKLTFNEVETQNHFGLMAKQRLAIIKKDIFDQLALAV